MINLGTLKEITDLRSVWPHEALNFTPWVAENVDLLGDAVGLDITVDETESSVGDFNVDIYATETGTERKIIIENQLEDTNHDHLGKLITYASGKGADIVVWIVKRAREEHRAAIQPPIRMCSTIYESCLPNCQRRRYVGGNRVGSPSTPKVDGARSVPAMGTRHCRCTSCQMCMSHAKHALAKGITERHLKCVSEGKRFSISWI